MKKILVKVVVIMMVVVVAMMMMTVDDDDDDYDHNSISDRERSNSTGCWFTPPPLPPPKQPTRYAVNYNQLTWCCGLGQGLTVPE